MRMLNTHVFHNPVFRSFLASRYNNKDVVFQTTLNLCCIAVTIPTECLRKQKFKVIGMSCNNGAGEWCNRKCKCLKILNRERNYNWTRRFRLTTTLYSFVCNIHNQTSNWLKRAKSFLNSQRVVSQSRKSPLCTEPASTRTPPPHLSLSSAISIEPTSPILLL